MGACFSSPKTLAMSEFDSKIKSHTNCPACNTKALLYIDDERDNLELFKGVLVFKWKAKGWGQPPPLVTMTNPAGAIHYLEAHPLRFPMIICDYSMPELNGIETCRALASINPDIFLCILSAYTSEDQRSKENHLTFYSKPDDMEPLYQKIHELLPSTIK